MRRALLASLAAGWLLACGEARRYDQTVCVLVDVSGTYADQKADVVRLVKRDLLPALVPGDSLLVIRIDGQSYEKANLEALVTLDARPSQANAQKLALAQNPKTPQPLAMGLVSQLQDSDLAGLMKSKDVPAAIATHARRQLSKKGKI